VRLSKKIAASVSIVAAGTLVTGIAFAAWTASGDGSGSAKAISAVALTTVTATPTAQLYPGGSGDLSISIANANPYPVKVTSVTNQGLALHPITSDKGPACDLSTGVTFTDQSALSLLVPAGSPGTSFTLTGTVHMANASDNSCQGGTFTIPVTASGASNAS
jgi:hypothetical protein